MTTLLLTFIIIAVLFTAVFVFKFIKTKRVIHLISVALVYSALIFAYYLIIGIEAPIKFKEERAYRYEHVINRLKDIRKAELAYKDQFGHFTGSFDTLINFVKTDSLRLTRKLGSLPDTLNERMAFELGLSITKLPAEITKKLAKKVLNKDIPENFVVKDETSIEKALKLGFLIRDTININVKDSILGHSYIVDSLRYVPFSSKHAEFKLGAGTIETASKIKVHVFEAVDTDPFDPNKVLQVGSLTETTNNAGNWE